MAASTMIAIAIIVLLALAGSITGDGSIRGDGPIVGVEWDVHRRSGRLAAGAVVILVLASVRWARSATTSDRTIAP